MTAERLDFAAALEALSTFHTEHIIVNSYPRFEGGPMVSVARVSGTVDDVVEDSYELPDFEFPMPAMSIHFEGSELQSGASLTFPEAGMEYAIFEAERSRLDLHYVGAVITVRLLESLFD